MKFKTMVSICIPTLGRPEKLRRLLQSIKDNSGWDNYEIIIEEDQMPPNNAGAPTILARCVAKSKGELVMFLGNDCVMKPDCVKEAVFAMKRAFPEMDGMVGLNDEFWQGDKGHVSPHWLASKKLLPMLGGNFFETEFYHTGVDNILQAQCERAGKYVWEPRAKIFHDHPMVYQYKRENDALYEQAYSGPRKAHDDELYEKRMKELGLENRKF